nr:MAG TPA: phosphoadenosine-phosphosulfate reductase [Caudoviricetes sp.]
MALIEYDLFGEKRDKVQIVIERLQAFEPKEGYYVADSGGKDSTCVVKLCEMAGVKFDAHYNATTIDPPQLVRFIRQYHPRTEIEKPEYTMRELIIKAQHPPTRYMRYCCAKIKETRGKGRIVVTGVRWAESLNRRKKRGLVNIDGEKARKIADELGAEHRDDRYGIILNTDNDENRRMVEMCYRTHQTLVNPIIDWTDEDVWQFIKRYNVPYCELYDCGFKRLGCVACPLGGSASMQRALEFFPQFKKFYVRTFDEMLDARRKAGKPIDRHWTDGESVLRWWVGKGGESKDELQLGIFDETEEKA